MCVVKIDDVWKIGIEEEEKLSKLSRKVHTEIINMVDEHTKKLRELVGSMFPEFAEAITMEDAYKRFVLGFLYKFLNDYIEFQADVSKKACCELFKIGFWGDESEEEDKESDS